MQNEEKQQVALSTVFEGSKILGISKPAFFILPS